MSRILKYGHPIVTVEDNIKNVRMLSFCYGSAVSAVTLKGGMLDQNPADCSHCRASTGLQRRGSWLFNNI